MRLILGSQSPRRGEILKYFSIPFEQVTSNFEEELVPFEGDPIAYTSTLAKGKALSLAPRFPDATILTADTVVFKDGKIFNKPATDEENFEMLKKFNGSWQSVFTAVVASHGKKMALAYAESRILFKSVSEADLRLYHQAFKGCDKAGGYSIEKGGSVVIERLEGCFYNVLGLPITGLQKVLKEMGINLWHYLNSSVPSS